MNQVSSYFNSSIGRKQIVAVTGLLLILFILGHLAGNLLIYLGPDAYNLYSKKLTSLRPGLYLIELVLSGIFITHVWFTVLLVLENINARPIRYAISRPVGERSFATRISFYTGSIIFIFVATHLLDFTFTEHHGPQSVLKDGINYGLYGLVYNSFSNPLHSLWYVVAICCLGFHLSHGIQSCVQTFGYNHPDMTPKIKKWSNFTAMVVTLLYCSIPVYVLINSRSF